MRVGTTTVAKKRNQEQKKDVLRSSLFLLDSPEESDEDAVSYFSYADTENK